MPLRSLKAPLSRALLACTASLCALGCSARYPGVLPPRPLWLEVELQQFNPQERGVIYGRGQAAHKLRIDQRRAIAEAAAVASLRELLIKRVTSLMETGDQGRKPTPSASERQEVQALLKAYPWSQAAQVEGRFFDAAMNTQFAIASLSLQAFEKTLSFGPSDPTTKAATTEYVRAAFKSLRP